MTKLPLIILAVVASYSCAIFAQELRFYEYHGDPSKPFDQKFSGKQITDPQMLARLRASRETQNRNAAFNIKHRPERSVEQSITNIDGPRHTAKLVKQTVENFVRDPAVERTGNATSTGTGTTTAPAGPSPNFTIDRVTGCTATTSSSGNTIFISGGTTCTIDLAVHKGDQFKRLTISHIGEVGLARKSFHYHTCVYYYYTGVTVCSAQTYVDWASDHYNAQFQATYVGCGLQTSVKPGAYSPQTNADLWKSPYTVTNTYDVHCEEEDSITISIDHTVTEVDAGANNNYVYYGGGSYIVERSISLGRSNDAFAVAGSWALLAVALAVATAGF